MTAIERARHYAVIFLNAGDNWHFYVPLDATVSDNEVYLQGVRMRPVADTWELSTNGQTWIMSRAEVAP